jgi:hypothetical protein
MIVLLLQLFQVHTKSTMKNAYRQGTGVEPI